MNANMHILFKWNVAYNVAEMMYGECFGCQSHGIFGNIEIKLFLKVGSMTCYRF